MTAETVTSAPAARRPWAAWTSVLCLIALVVLVALLPGLRSLAADAWREVWSIPPPTLALIAALMTAQALLSSLSWRNAIRAAWPRAPVSYRFVLGVDQGQDVVNTVLPGRAGTWAMLGVVRGALRGAPVSTVLAAWGAHNLAFVVFAMTASLVAAAGVPGQGSGSPGGRLTGFATERPLLAAAIGVAVVAAGVVAAMRWRSRLVEAWRQAAAGLSILRSPSRYGLLLFLPALGSYALRCVACAALLAAYGIPVTVWSVALALGSHALAGAVRVTPGGLGTTQVADVVALGAYASPEVVTAWSLAEIALNAMASLAVAVVALVSLAGLRGSRVLLAHLRRGELAAGLRAVGARERALRTRVTHRRPPGP